MLHQVQSRLTSELIPFTTFSASEHLNVTDPAHSQIRWLAPLTAWQPAPSTHYGSTSSYDSTVYCSLLCRTLISCQAATM